MKRDIGWNVMIQVLFVRKMNFILLTIIGIIANVAQAQVEFPPSSGRSQIIERHIPASAVTITSGLDQAYRVAWSPDSKYFAVIGAKGSGDGTTFSVVVYDADTQKMIQTLPVKKPGSLVGDIAFSPDGKYLAAGIGIITLWDAKNWQPVRDIAGPYIDIPSQRTFGSSGVHSIIFSPDSRVLTVLYDSVSYWPTSVTNKTKEAADSLQSLLASSKRDGTFWEKMNREELATGLSTIMAFDVETTKRLFTQPSSIPTPEKNSRFSGNLAYSPDGKYLLSSRIEIHQLKPGEHYRHFTFLEFRDPQMGHIVKEIADPHVMQVTAIAASRNGKYIVTGTNTLSKERKLNQFTKNWELIDNNDPIRLWGVADGKKMMEYGSLRGAVRSLTFSPDGSVLISCQTDLEKKETIWLWDVKSGQIIDRVITPRSGSEFFACAVSPDGRTIAMPVISNIYLISMPH